MEVTKEQIAAQTEKWALEQKKQSVETRALNILSFLIMGEIKRETYNETPSEDLVDKAFDMANYFGQKIDAIK